LDSTPETLDELKFILRTISEIKDISLQVEVRIRDLQERYRVLDMYALVVCT
jgi:dynein heavy chain